MTQGRQSATAAIITPGSTGPDAVNWAEFRRAPEEDAVPEKRVWQLLVSRSLRKMVLGVVHGAPGMGHVAMGKSTGWALTQMWSCTCIVKTSA